MQPRYRKVNWLRVRPVVAVAIAIALVVGCSAFASQFNVCDYGAKGDGKTLATNALNKAIEACAGAGGGQVLIPPGKYLTGTVHLRSNVTILLETDAELIGTRDLSKYEMFTPPKGNPLAAMPNWHRALILADGAEN